MRLAVFALILTGCTLAGNALFFGLVWVISNSRVGRTFFAAPDLLELVRRYACCVNHDQLNAEAERLIARIEGK